MYPAKYLDGLAVQFASLNVYPLGVSSANADHESSLCGSGNSRCWNEERRLRPADRPKHFGKHPGTETSIRVVDVQLDRHSPCFHIHRMSNTGNRPPECLIGEGGNAEFNLASDVDARRIFLWDRDNEPEPGGLFNPYHWHGRPRATCCRSGKRSRMYVSFRHNAVERSPHLEVSFDFCDRL